MAHSTTRLNDACHGCAPVASLNHFVLIGETGAGNRLCGPSTVVPPVVYGPAIPVSFSGSESLRVSRVAPGRQTHLSRRNRCRPEYSRRPCGCRYRTREADAEILRLQKRPRLVVPLTLAGRLRMSRYLGNLTYPVRWWPALRTFCHGSPRLPSHLSEPHGVARRQVFRTPSDLARRAKEELVLTPSGDYLTLRRSSAVSRKVPTRSGRQWSL